MKKFIFLLREDINQFRELSPQQMQDELRKHLLWNISLKKKGVFLVGESLLKKAKLISGSEKIITETETNEKQNRITGFYIIQAKDENEAINIAKDCPILEKGGSLEIWPGAM